MKGIRDNLLSIGVVVLAIAALILIANEQWLTISIGVLICFLVVFLTCLLR